MTKTEIDIDTIIKAVILIASSAEEEGILRTWVDNADLAIALALSVRDNLITGLTQDGENVIRQSITVLAEAVGMSEDKLIDLAFGIDDQAILT